MVEVKQKIPFLLKLKRFKNSKSVEKFDDLFQHFKPPKKFKGIPSKIVIFRNDRIGDAIVTLPVLRDLKLNYPNIKIDVLTSKINKFVFQNLDYIDNAIEFDWQPSDLKIYYKFPFFGSFIQFLRYNIIPTIFSSEKRNLIKYLIKKKYDVSIDLVGLKRNILLSKLISDFSAGPKKFGVYFLYDYYIDSNWVTLFDSVFMTNKIEKVIKGGLNINFEKRNYELPLLKINPSPSTIKKYDIVFHIGTLKHRMLSLNKEIEIIKYLDKFNILVFDSGKSNKYLKLQKEFEGVKNIDFRVFDSFEQAAETCAFAKVLICYDGGQAHYLSQYVKTLVLFGPGSVDLWKPYEFADYNPLCEDENGCKAIISNGEKKHIAIFFPIWCRPCFDVGCSEKICLEKINAKFIKDIIFNYCM